ncbi:MAG: aminotransferase class V-fold PLP-dependent enzyme [Alphaproteobacteria bacterium]|nr:aminotransferase class V-fold PLP-dependent enzyme [Alphaproteobacteria bacterium]
MSDRVYADFNAGAPLRPEAREAMLRALDAQGNPSSVHAAGRRARALLETAREEVAESVGARPENVIFTSGATEALHLALEAAREAAGGIVLSAIEHDALTAQAANVYADVRTAPVTTDGAIDLDAFETLLDGVKHPLAAVMAANNETGAVQPVAQAAACVRERGGLLLVDAAQALGRIPVDVADFDASYLVLSSHKIGGPQGAGALVLAPGAPFTIARGGGGQERGRRPGTENVAAIAGFGAACRAAVEQQPSESVRLAALRDAFEAGVRGRFPDSTIFSESAPRLASTSLVAVSGLRAETALIALDLEGVCVSSGAACSSGKVRASRVLTAMGAAPERIQGALRFSFGWSSTERDVARCLDALDAAVARARPRTMERAV